MSTETPSEHPKYARARSLGNEITALYGLITAATYELLVKIGKFDRDRLWEDAGLVSCAHWLNWKCGIGMNAAREKVRVANALGKLPKISEAFRNGEISFSKVRAITRVANEENEDYLLMIARHGTAHHVETLIRGYRRAERLDDPDNAPHECREFNYHWDDDGSLVFKARLPAEVGAMLMKALQASIDHAEKEVSADDVPSGQTREPIAARRADAIAEMAETYLASGPAKSSSADRYQVMVHITAETSAGESHVEDGPHVTAVTSKRICCDASITRMLEDDDGEPLSIGRKSRVIPAAMRRALQARDKGCRFPGCTHRHFIDGHHIKHWADGGETSLDNLVQLCRRHHRLVHEGGFSCEKNPDGSIEFRDRMGNVIPRSVVPGAGFRGNVVANLQEELEDRFIDSATCVTKWTGEQMDRDLAVSMLWDLNHRPSDYGSQSLNAS